MRSFVVCIVVAWVFAVSPRTKADQPRVDFNRDIRPILSDSCFTCHGPDEAARDSELRLDTKDGAFVDLGGYRAIVPGDADGSELILRLEPTLAIVLDRRRIPAANCRKSRSTCCGDGSSKEQSGKITGHSSRPSRWLCRR